MGSSGRRDKWVNAHHIERLDQLLFDIQLIRGRYMYECLKAAAWLPGQREEWQQAAQAGEVVLQAMEERCKVLFDLYCREHKELE